MSNVIAMRPSDRLHDQQKQLNWLALQPSSPFLFPGGIYADRTDIGIDAFGYLQIPCFECGHAVRTYIDLEMEGERPLPHDDDEGAVYTDDCVTCKYCAACTQVAA